MPIKVYKNIILTDPISKVVKRHFHIGLLFYDKDIKPSYKLEAYFIDKQVEEGCGWDMESANISLDYTNIDENEYKWDQEVTEKVWKVVQQRIKHILESNRKLKFYVSKEEAKEAQKWKIHVIHVI